MNTIAQQLNVKKFPFEIKDENGSEIYFEDSDGYWFKKEFDSKGNDIYYENSTGYWSKYEYDTQGNEIYLEDSDGVWYKREFDAQGNQIYYENSKGLIVDKRPKPVIELTLEDVAKLAGVSVEQIKIKK